MLFSMYDTYKIRRYKHEHNSSVQNVSWLVTYVATGLTELKTKILFILIIHSYQVYDTKDATIDYLSFSKSYTFDFILYKN